MDLSFATIPMFGGKYLRLYRENQLAYMISNPKNPTNHPMYVLQDDLNSFVLHMDGDHTKLAREQPRPTQTNLRKGNVV